MSTGLSRIKRALVLGYYDRYNAGDEQYKVTIPLYFGSIFEYDFVSTDDATAIDVDGYDIVICGGGDIINPYFMDKVEDLISEYTGPIYAFSVGVPYDEDVRYMDIFDHAVVRSMYDYEIVAKRLGSKNATFLPDAGFLNRVVKPVRDALSLKVGICVATPILEARPNIVGQIANAMAAFYRSNPNCEFHFIAFNTNPLDPKEADMTSTNKILDALDETTRQQCVVRNDALSTSQILVAIAQMRFTICMRYHSAIFSIITQTPIIAIAATKKMKQLLIDNMLPSQYIIDIEDIEDGVNNDDKLNALSSVMDERNLDPQSLPVPDVGRLQGNATLREVIGNGQYRSLLVQSQKLVDKTLEEVIDDCIDILNAMFAPVYVTDEVLRRKGPFPTNGKNPEAIARVVCLAITGSFENSCWWGLSQNLMKSDFVMYDAIEYIYGDMKSKEITAFATSEETYLPSVDVRREMFLSIDPFVDSKSRSEVHRSGWNYVVNHLANYEASRFRRRPMMIFDTYVDRTFHWGFEPLFLSGLLPYTSSWMGVIHHTYDVTQSSYNCEELFKNTVFLKSLAYCKCLIVLSAYLASQVRLSLLRVGRGNVDVAVLIHPTEFVEPENMFSMTKLVAGTKKVVQIGAWLRNPYSIFGLPLFEDKLNPLKLKKAALKGENMDGYYITDEKFLEIIDAIDGATNEPLPIYTCDPQNPSDPTPIMVRNKFVVGMVKSIIYAYDSVEMIYRLSNAEYDELLASNIVFIDLVDCSAVNTVLECIVRNTVLVVNRHPALEEVLGKNYPGFYDSLVGATVILGSVDKLSECYLWLTELDKTELRIETFVQKLQSTVVPAEITI
jgi:hypothetical protein